MPTPLEGVTEWLLQASESLDSRYFQLPVVGKEEPEYRERVYCYELYHLWRSQWSANFPYSLCGEVDKKGHPVIRGEAKPDFLVHIPGEMTNLVVVEVKPANAKPHSIVEDLEKLTKFSRDLAPDGGQGGNYEAAYLWIYGLPLDEWPSLRQRVLAAASIPDGVDPDLVACFIHERPGTRSVEVPWE